MDNDFFKPPRENYFIKKSVTLDFSRTRALKPQPHDGYLRLSQIIGPKGLLPISKSTWWAGVASGRFPRPVKFGGVTMWRKSDIFELIREIDKSQPEGPQSPNEHS